MGNIFSSSSRETPNRIQPNLSHLLILCVFTSVLCGVNKEVKGNNQKKKKKKFNLGLLYTNPGSTDNNLKGKKTQNYEPNEFDRMRVKQFLSETVAMHP